MDKVLLVLGTMPPTAIDLIQKLMCLGVKGEIEVRVMHEAGLVERITGSKIEQVIFDDVTHPDVFLANKVNLLEELHLHAANAKPHPCRAEPYDNRPRSKGDRHRNKRYRWS